MCTRDDEQRRSVFSTAKWSARVPIDALGTRVESVAGKLLICPKVWRAGARNASRLLTRRRYRTPLFLVGWPEDRVCTCQVEMAAVPAKWHITQTIVECGHFALQSFSLGFLALGYRPDFNEQLWQQELSLVVGTRTECSRYMFDHGCSSTNVLKKLENILREIEMSLKFIGR